MLRQRVIPTTTLPTHFLQKECSGTIVTDQESYFTTEEWWDFIYNRRQVSPEFSCFTG
ncbi:hypothetical protein SKAU_G00353980 [Synaphobranchus kaupii]|uniref:Uncharacterized protein n=1 Tax=Synaphobranchus kaupii TaxID=118154 RepID=A0A9Q1IG89_SYNKA|nr:hypothetical protein SKAU_G00353980 [Synaphobranchus kaupii]